MEFAYFRRQLDLGNKYQEEFDYEQAVAALTNTLRIKPDDPNIIDIISNTYRSSLL